MTPASTNHRVFVVDDSDLLRLLIVETIDYWPGFEICGEAATAEEAYENLATSRPDVAIVDIGLPGITGIELVRRLTTRNPEMRCIMFTAYDSAAMRLQAEQAGALEYVVKGDTDGLYEALKRALRTDRTQPAAA